MLKKLTSTFLFAAGFLAVQAQSPAWSLEKCITYAQQNNLTLKLAEYDIRNAELDLEQDRFSRMPTLSANGRAGYQFGRTIDPTTNTFNNQRIGFNSYSLDASVSLYNGGAIHNSIQQSQVNARAARLDAKASSNDIALSVASTYLSILLAEEQLANAKKNLELTQEQLSQTDKLIDAGSLPENDRLDFLSQIAVNEQAIIEAENQVAIGYLNLKQLLQLPPEEQLQIVRPEFIEAPEAVSPDVLNLDKVYLAALQTQPQVRSAELRVESAQFGEKIARSGFLPSLAVFANLNSNYSSAFSRPITETLLVPQTVFIDGNPVVIEFESTVPVDFEQISYPDQLDQNFGQVVGVNLSIPIYSRNTNRINVERARVGALRAETASEQINQQLKTDVQRAIADTRASYNNYQAAQRAVEASAVAFENAEQRFDLGAINTLEYTTARNTLDRARTDAIRAKYQFIFNLKTVDFYLGKELKLNSN